MITFEWKDLGWIAGVSLAVGGLLLAFLRFKLAGDFAGKVEVGTLSGRMAVVEQRMAAMPSHDDLKALQARVGGLETQIAVVGEQVRSVAQGVGRVEHQLGLVSQHLINEGR